MSLARRQELLDHAERHDLLIIEDDYDSEMTFADSGLPAMKSLDRSGHVIYLGSLSKTLAPGLRIGFMVGSPELIAEARVLRRLMLRHPPANNQRAAALFISLGHYDTLLRRTKKSLSERAHALSTALMTHAPALRFAALQGGSSVWVEGPKELDSSLLARIAERQGILIEPGDLFFHQPPAPCPYFRLGFASTPSDKISEGVRRLALLINDARV
jgi:GntR family transcriptional regulator/MocR family aminotransferase